MRQPSTESATALPVTETDAPSDAARRLWLQRAAATAGGAVAAGVAPAVVAQPTAVPSGAVSLRATGAAAFAKTLPHDARGAVAAADMAQFETATKTAQIADWEQLPVNHEIRLVNPLAAYSWEKEPLSREVPKLPPFPALDSERLADEALELYWMALLRDVPLWDYDRAGLVRDAVAELRRTKTFASVTPQTLFRLGVTGDGDGHWFSQLLWMPVPYGAQNRWQQYRVAFRGTDFMTTWDEYLKVASGEWPPGIINHYADLFYLRSGRDAAEYVHWDFSYQAFIDASSILLGNPHRPREGWSAANPYKSSRAMNGFVSFGPAHVHNAMGSVSDFAFKACWDEKWLRHRALRPEAYGALVDRATRGETVGIHPLIVNSEAVKRVKARHGSALLPQSYPEGAPAHPAYPSGHASIAGACVTVLKAMFDERRKLRFPLQPTRDGKDWESLDPNLPAPTVGSELNKLAMNVAMGRNFAGIHWRSDAWQGLLLGEHVARAWLKAEKAKSLEGQQGWLKSFEFTGFAGQRVTV
ncbi:MAG: vanadium-dependent haloperoxidase [Burkholderiales bacterium]|nr:vanadium-dependent haloperoxidase [Burkholderiales bacterium]